MKKPFMAAMLLKNANIVLPDGLMSAGSVSIREGKIEALGQIEPRSGDEIDPSGGMLLPGFVDVHNHGATGHDVNQSTAEDLLEVAVFLASKGVTAWLPTLVPDSDDNYRRVIAEIDRLMEMQERKPVAQTVGVHYEGVFANKAMCGALRPEYFKSGRQLAGSDWQLPRLKKGVHMTTLAPEIEGGIELIEELVKGGWIVSIGHTKADVQTLDKAFAAGAKHLTHFFNAMSGVNHREIGVAGWGLSNKNVTFDIIADGIHVEPRMLEFACRSKGVDKVSLISDSVGPTGLGDGEYTLWGENISVINGRTRNERGSIAGSVITMHDAFRRMLSLGFSRTDVANMASANPAALIGLDGMIGSIEVGKCADLVALDNSGNVQFTMIRGKLVEN